MMGSDRSERTKPIHKVELESFWITRFPVTQDLYKWVMGKNPFYFRGKQRPVDQVDWYDGIEFCNALSKEMGLKAYYKIDRKKKDPNYERESDTKKWLVEINEDSKGYRLLREEEWEYAARGGKLWRDQFLYSGRNQLNEVGWNRENSHEESKEVGLKAPNQLGLYDMSGNVEEWCWDWYVAYNNRIKITYYRVVRGGSWDHENSICYVAYRYSFSP
ncbi:unnamed protein product [Scytosiphon promiscuus]